MNLGTPPKGMIPDLCFISSRRLSRAINWKGKPGALNFPQHNGRENREFRNGGRTMKTLELVRKAYELDLEGVHILDKYSITQVESIYNGIGPDRFPDWLRKIARCRIRRRRHARTVHSGKRPLPPELLYAGQGPLRLV